jgi:hypothetical protein
MSAGSYVPFGLRMMSKGWAVAVLTVVWTGALVAIVLRLFWTQAPKVLWAAIALGLGWVGAAAFPQLRALPRADGRRRRLPVGSDRVLRAAARLGGAAGERDGAPQPFELI